MIISKTSIRSSYISLYLAGILLVPISISVQWMIAIFQFIAEKQFYSFQTQTIFIFLTFTMFTVFFSLFLFIIVRFSNSITVTDHGFYLSRIFGIRTTDISWFEITLVKCKYMRAARGGFYSFEMTITTTKDQNHIIKCTLVSLSNIQKFCSKITEFTNQSPRMKIEDKKSLFVIQRKISRFWHINHNK
jgi:hypothetical protein